MAEVQVNGVRFHVQRLGSGTRTVVFLHGLIMDNLSSWFFTVANPVATFSDVLLYDLRGHGRSERPPTGYHLDQMVADLAGLLDANGKIGPVTLVGNSYGALLALAFAVAHPERVEGLVLVDGHLSDDGWAENMVQVLRLEGAARDSVIIQNFRAWMGRHSTRKRNRLASTARELVYETTLVDDIGATPEVGPTQIRALRCPVLAIYGEHSDILSHGQRMAGALEDCELRVSPGCTHSVIWEATARLREEVVAWLQRDPAAWAGRISGQDATRGS